MAIEHKKFRDQYKSTTSADWQTFQLGLDAGWEAALPRTKLTSNLLNTFNELINQLTGEQEDEEELEKGLGITLAIRVINAKKALIDIVTLICNDFCTCGNPSGEGNIDFVGDEELIYKCCDCNKIVKK